MKAILVPKPGGPEALVYGEAPDPVPGPDEVLVRVRATAVNRADLLQSEGKYPPPPGASEILGLEAAGEVEGTGEKVFFLLSGRRLRGEGRRAARDAHARCPRASRLAEAAAIPEAWFTAYLNLFFEGALKPGETAARPRGRVGRRDGGDPAREARRVLRRRDGALARRNARRSPRSGRTSSSTRPAQEFLSRIEAKFGKESVDLVLDSGRRPALRAEHPLAPPRRPHRPDREHGRAGRRDRPARVLSKRLRIIGSTLRGRPLEEKIDLTAGVRPGRPARVRGREPRARHRLRLSRSGTPRRRTAAWPRTRTSGRSFSSWTERAPRPGASARGRLRPRRHASRLVRGDPRVPLARPRGVRTGRP